MLLHRYRGCLLGVIGLCLLALGPFSRGSEESRADAIRFWRDLGRQLLYELGTGRGLATEWLDRKLEVVDPNTGQAVKNAELLLRKALDGYGQEALAVEGRIPLDMNPQCLLGLYVADRFPGTRIGDWGSRQFARSVEQACLAALPTAGGNWHAQLEAEMLAAPLSKRTSREGAFTAAEAPYLHCYLVKNAPSIEARHRARERLARCLWQEYGVAPGLRQYLLLLEQSNPADEAWLQEAVGRARLGPHPVVKKLHEHQLMQAESLESARQVGERLAGILLGESRYRQAKSVLDQVSQRFGPVTWMAPEIKDFLQKSPGARAGTRPAWVREFAQTTRELQALQWCRILDALWTPQEAPQQWLALLSEIEPGILAQQCGRVFLAKALLRVGKVEAAAGLVREQTPGASPFLQAQNRALSAEIAYTRGQEEESVRLYIQALQIDRPTSAPGWCQGLVPVEAFTVKVSAAELRAQRLFLQSYQDLLDGDAAAALDRWSRVAGDLAHLPNALRRILPCMMMTACLGVEDYVGAEMWGYHALARYQKDHPEHGQARDLLTRIEDLERAMYQLVRTAREEATSSSAAVLVAQALQVCEAGGSLEQGEPLAEALGKGIQQSYVGARRRRDGQLLLAEYCYLVSRALDQTKPRVDYEPLLFVAQVLGQEPLDRIRENLVSLAPDAGARERLHRFAAFALQANRPDLMRGALDLAANVRPATEVTPVASAPRPPRGVGEDPAGALRVNVIKSWRDLGRQLLYELGTGRGLATEWLDREVEAVDPNTGQAVKNAELLLRKALDGYGQEALAVEGRIPLDMNPQCLLGLYVADRFPGTRIGDWGSRQFARCVEQACLAALPAAGGNAWRARLEVELLVENEASGNPFHVGAFTRAEIPYLYLYLACTAQPVDTQHKARRCLARHFWEEYGLEPGLRQYLILWNQGCGVDSTWLEVATQLDRIGFHQKAKELYRRIIQNANTAEERRHASEGLAGILIAESRQREARMVLSSVSQSSPEAEWNTQEVRDFWRDYQLHRGETSKQLTRELIKTTTEPRALQWCRLLDGLWTPEEAPGQWQAIVHGAEEGTLAEQCGRVFLAKALLRVGKVDAAQVIIRGLTESISPFLQAQSLAILAEIAQVKGTVEESARLYSKALQTSRTTPLPEWCQSLMQILPLDTRMPEPGFQAWARFLGACNNLTDGDVAAAADTLASLATVSHSLPDSLQGALPTVMALTYWGMGDCAEAEAWGLRALEKCREDHPGDDRIHDLLAKAHEMDMAARQLVARARDKSAVSPTAPAIWEQVIHLCDTSTSLDLLGSRTETSRDGIPRFYVQAKKRQIAQILMTEYRWIRQRWIGKGRTGYSSNSDLLLFAAQVFSGESIDRIQKSFASLIEDEGVNDRMYRFVMFVRKINRPDLVRSALDAAADEQKSTANVEALEDIAQMYLANSSHQKAIDLYRAIAANSQNLDKAQSAQLKIVDLYAEDLKSPGKALQECERFIRSYPSSPLTSQIEFLMGRLAYLNKDYSGAVGQLDSFQKRYPEHSQVGQAMMLAALSRMAEGNTKEAIGRFSEIIRRYPDEELAARSKFLIGYAQMSEQQYSTATETFKQFIEQFPHSQYVTQARIFIDRLNKVSR